MSELEELLIKVRADVNQAIADLKRVERAGDDLEGSVAGNSAKIGKDVGSIGTETDKAARQVTKSTDSVRGDFAKMVGVSDDAAKRFDRNFKSSQTAGEAFGKTIAEMTGRQKVLADLFNKTGDDKFLKSLRQSEKDVRKLTAASDDLTNALGKDVSSAASEASGSLDAMGPAIAGIIAELAPLLGGALSGGILALVGAGGIAAGIAGQLNSPLVSGALQGFGRDIQSEFYKATQSFAPVLADSLGALDNNLGPFWDSLKKGMADLAPYLKALTDGLILFLNNIDLEAVFKGAEPVLTAIAQELPQMGQALTMFFKELSEGGTGAAQSIGFIFEVLDTAIVEVGGLLRGMSNSVEILANGLQKVLDALGHIPGPIGAHFRNAGNDLRSFTTQVATATPYMQDFNGAVQDTNDSLSQQAQNLHMLAQSFDQLTDKQLASQNAQLKAIEAEDNFTKALAKNRGEWRMTTQAGRDHWHALLDNIQAQKDLFDSDVNVNGVTKKNVDTYNKAIEKLLAQAQAAGLSASQIADLKQKYENLNAVLSTINGRKIHFTISATAKGAVAGIAAGDIASAFANSGIDYAGVRAFANSGVAGNIPHFDATGVFAGTPGGIYRFAEASTGREALIAEHGDSGRALGALASAASWHGATVVTNPLSSTYNHASVANTTNYGGGVGMVATTVVIDGQAVVRAITPAVQRTNWRTGVSVFG